ncbi:MAG: enoyl-CoA hydratase [Actinobacteria bacterium]|nr:MAG: enoyl-CoA hydratase [Actinomycetota bacterium]
MGDEQASSPEVVHYERDGKVAVITLDRPPVNAYTARMHTQLERAWRRAELDDDAAVVVLRAEGKHFCGGAELKPSAQDRADDAGERVSAAGEWRSTRDIPKPTIAAVQGACVGGGQRMVWPCDLIFCSEDAFFRDPLVQFGVGGIQSHGHTWAYGPRLAKEMLFTGNPIPAMRLYQMGMVNRVVTRDRLDAETMEAAHQIAEMPAFGLRQAKRAVNTTMDIMGQHYILSRMEELLDGFDMSALHPES